MATGSIQKKTQTLPVRQQLAREAVPTQQAAPEEAIPRTSAWTAKPKVRPVAPALVDYAKELAEAAAQLPKGNLNDPKNFLSVNQQQALGDVVFKMGLLSPEQKLALAVHDPQAFANYSRLAVTPGALDYAKVAAREVGTGVREFDNPFEDPRLREAKQAFNAQFLRDRR